MKLYRIHGREKSRRVPATLLDLRIGDPIGAWLEGEVPLAVAALAMKRGNVAMEAPTPKEAGSAAPGEGAPSLVGKAASATGSLGAIAVSSDTVPASSPLAFLALSAGMTTSFAFLFWEVSSSVMTGGTLAIDGWPMFLAPVLQLDRVSKVIRVQ